MWYVMSLVLFVLGVAHATMIVIGRSQWCAAKQFQHCRLSQLCCDRKRIAWLIAFQWCVTDNLISLFLDCHHVCCSRGLSQQHGIPQLIEIEEAHGETDCWNLHRERTSMLRHLWCVNIVSNISRQRKPQVSRDIYLHRISMHSVSFRPSITWVQPWLRHLFR